MNRIIKEQWSMFAGTHTMRSDVLETLADSDLTFSPGGQNMTLGELFREMGEVQHSYAQSFQTFEQDFAYHTPDQEVAKSVKKLGDWFTRLDAELEEAVSALSDDDIAKRTIERNNYQMPIEFQLQAYLQALLIFLGKASIFLRAMSRPLPEKIRDWIW